MRLSWIGLMMAFTAAGCANAPPDVSLDEAVEAKRLPDPPKPVQLIEVPQLLPLPGQLKSSPIAHAEASEAPDPVKRVNKANESARVQPAGANFMNANQIWPYAPDALYQVYASPEKVTDIALEPREELVAAAAGDTVRWIIADTTSGEGNTQRVHILVKPTRADLKTNLVITSNRRTYHLELTATAQTWMASVSWAYPLDQMMVLKAAAKRAADVAPIAQGIALDHLNFRYTISGDRPAWRPLRAFDDGQKVYLQFPAHIAEGDLPPLFIVGANKTSELVNYRVRAPYYIIDRLFAAAELRLGARPGQRVRIERTDRDVQARSGEFAP